MTGDRAAGRRALDFQRGNLERVAETFEVIPEGWLIRTPSRPGVWSTNQVRISRPVEFAEAVALADEHLAELPYRQIALEDQDSGPRLEGEFRAAGWKVDREVTMLLRAEPDRRVDTSRVEEVGEQEALGLMGRWIDEEPEESLTPGGREQLRDNNLATWRARNAIRLGVRGESGRLAAISMLFSDGQVAQVEDVYCAPEERGQGFARALVTRAVELAREAEHELTFIVGDDDDWPKQLYAQIGFQPVERVWLFHRELGQPPARRRA